MMANHPEPEFSTQGQATLEIALAGMPGGRAAHTLGISAAVRYVAGVLEPDDATEVELAIMQDLRAGDLLATTYRIVESLRILTWQELQSMEPSDELTSQIRIEWMDCARTSLIPEEQPNFTIAGLLNLAKTGIQGARTAMGIVSQLLEPGLAPRMPAFAAATRLAANVPLVEGAELREAGYEFESEITVDGTLRLDMRFREAASLSGRTIWIAFEANRQWLCLGFVEVGDRAASMLLPGFGKLLDLSPGPLPANIFAVRLDEWPSVCEHGALIVQSGPEPFAEIETDPLIENGNVRVGIRLLPYSADAWRSTEIEMWFGTGGHVWQLLGRWPLPEERGASMNLICPSPKPGPVGVAFPGVLRLALRS